MKKTEFFYAVEIKDTLTNRPSLALGTYPGPALFRRHKDAVTFKKVLIAKGFKTARVVNVLATHRWY